MGARTRLFVGVEVPGVAGKVWLNPLPVAAVEPHDLRPRHCKATLASGREIVCDIGADGLAFRMGEQADMLMNPVPDTDEALDRIEAASRRGPVPPTGA